MNTIPGGSGGCTPYRDESTSELYKHGWDTDLASTMGYLRPTRGVSGRSQGIERAPTIVDKKAPIAADRGEFLRHVLILQATIRLAVKLRIVVF